MLTCRPGAVEGFSLIELLITLAVLGIVLAIGLPNVSVWIQNTQLKTAAEGVVSGLQLARAEALRRNTNVRFALVNSLDNTCALVGTGPNWVVNVDDPADATDPAGACGAAASDTVAPFIVQKKSGAEGSPNATVAANASAAVFNGLGRLNTLFVNIAQINIRNPTGGACQSAGGPIRCLSITMGTGGQVRMCDPVVTDVNDSRSCGAGFAFVP